MDKPPQGKHSTKGLGKKMPLESEYAKWRDDVVVPCGKPVSSNVKASELMYNEYIVYNTAQVSFKLDCCIFVLSLAYLSINLNKMKVGKCLLPGLSLTCYFDIFRACLFKIKIKLFYCCVQKVL